MASEGRGRPVEGSTVVMIAGMRVLLAVAFGMQGKFPSISQDIGEGHSKIEGCPAVPDF